MSKTLGDVCREAYMEWGWQAAAEAVEAEIRKDIEPLLSPEAREVLLAAKAWYVAKGEQEQSDAEVWLSEALAAFREVEEK